MYKKIIVPVDLSATDKGEKILAKAKALLDADGEIVLINVVEELPGYMAIDLPVECDFMAVSSYGAATKTSGVVRIVWR